MMAKAKSYPDISDILQRKALGRVDMGGRSFAEKLDALDALRERAGPLRAARAFRGERYSFSESAQAMRRQAKGCERA